MSSPPVLQLSQALYSNIPWSARVPPDARASSRKREHGQVAASECHSASVRLLLPKAFDVADRAYHARQQCSEAAAASAAAGGEVGRVKVGLETSPCCGDGLEVEKRCLPVAATATGRMASDNSSSSSSSISCSTSAFPTARDCGGDSQQQSSHPLAAAAATVIAARGRGSADIVVVESVLGFSALHSLLERSLATAPRSRDYHRLNGPAGGEAGAADGCDGESDGRRREEKPDPGVSDAVGRLVGWLKIARASTALPEGHEGNDDISYHQHQTGRKCSSGSGRKKASPREPAAAATTTSASTDGLRYQVTGRCEVGSEWSVFTLEPATTQAREPEGSSSGIQLSDGGGGDGGGGGGDGGGGCSTERMQEIQLICHPLVTMVPDIRWCLRLISQAKATAGLMNANAKLSTLGGGYFLTRQVGQAINLARTQSEIAMALGDVQLAGKCRINEAYNYIWMGRYIEARRIIRTQVLASRAVKDEELENVATIASRFLRRSKKANRRLMETQIAAGHGGGSGGGDGNGDDCHKWMRQKVDVKTDEWHRVRALPLYCSSSSG